MVNTSLFFSSFSKIFITNNFQHKFAWWHLSGNPKRSSKQNSVREQNFIDMDTCGWSIRKREYGLCGGVCILLLV